MAIENEQDLVNAVKSLSDQLNGLGMKAKKTGDDLTTSQKAIKGAGDAAKSAVTGLGGFAAELGSGSADLKTFNKVIDTASAAVSAVASAFGPFGAAVGGLTKALAEGAKFVIGQLDATAKSFNEVSSVGATTAKGMQGLRDQQVRSGLSLAAFQKVVMANSETLARFKGLAGDGAEAFSDIIGRVSGVNKESDQTLRLLGMNAEQISATAGAFLQQQTRLGRSQTQSNADLAQGTVRYAKELDLLSKVTGQSRESIQKQQDAALSETRFRSVYQTMVNNGNEAAAKELMKFQTTISSVSKDTGKGIRDMSSGIIDSTEAQALMVATGGKALDISQRLAAGQLDAAQATEEMQAALKENESLLLQQGSANREAGATFGDIPGMVDLMNAKFDENGKMVAKATATQTAQISETDKLTKEVIGAQLAIEGMARAIDTLTIKMMPKAAEYTRQLSEAMRNLIDQIDEDLGRKGKGVDKQDDANWEKMTLSEKFQSGLARGLEKGARAVGADFVANEGQKNRVKSETEYLKGQGRPGVVDPSGGKSGAGGAGAGGGAAPSGGKSGAGGAGAGGGAPAAPTSKDDLAAAGLTIKKGDVQKEGAELDPRIIEMAKAVQSSIPGFSYFSGFNDAFHNEKSPTSQHTKGLAMDFVLQQKPSKEEGAKIVDMLKGMGASLAIDEYNNASAKATGGHIHAQISAKDGFNGMLSGPSGGYQPNLTMHGTEQLTVTPTSGANAPANNTTTDASNQIMMAQLARLEELVVVMKNQVGASERLIRMQS
jgi:hypothetical protein